jgi:TRAP-type C4-dicarboxylate transport system substrate-binding protein
MVNRELIRNQNLKQTWKEVLMKKTINYFAIVLIFVGLITLPTVLQASDKPIVVRMVGTLPVNHHLTKALQMFQEEVEKSAKNRVEFQLYPAQQLYNDKDLVNVLPKGAIEGAIINSGLWSGKAKAQGPLFFPMYFKSRDHFYRLFESEAWELMQQDFEKEANVKVLSLIEYGTATLICKKPVKTMEDFKGLRTRAYGTYPAVFLQAVAAAPVVMSSGEMYIALQRGTIDAALSGPSSFVDRKLFEVSEYFLEPDLFYSTPFLMTFNLDFWNSLPEDLKKVFNDAAQAVSDWTKEYTLQSDVEYRKILREKGLTELSISDSELERWRKVAVPALESAFRDEYGTEKANAVLDAIPTE